GEAAEETLLTGPRAVPGVLTDAGFEYTLGDLDRALAAALS
ncbi:DUF1731 domain-containing protein, partial [Saccharomonospora viridis]